MNKHQNSNVNPNHLKHRKNHTKNSRTENKLLENKTIMWVILPVSSIRRPNIYSSLMRINIRNMRIYGIKTNKKLLYIEHAPKITQN